jgi:hypothetical protein
MRKITLLIFIILILFSQLVKAEYKYSAKVHIVKKEYHKSIQLKKSLPIKISHSFGNIKVVPSKKNTFIVNGIIEVSSKSKKEAEAYIDDIFIDVQERMTHIKMDTELPSRKKIRSCSINFSITIPEKCNLDIKNNFGDVVIGEEIGTKNGLSVETSHGEITIYGCSGEANIINKFGFINVFDQIGDVTIESSNSKIKLIAITGNCTAENTFGKISAEKISGEVQISNSNDTVILSDIKGTVDVRNSFAEIDLKKIGKDLKIKAPNCRIELTDISGNAEITTTFGEINFEDIKGDLIIDGSNSKITGVSVIGAVTIDNSFGYVNLEKVGGKIGIKNPNGNISILSAKEEIHIRSRFSNVTVEDISGNIAIYNSNGTVTATKVGGDVNIENSFGPVRLSSLSGDVYVKNSNASVRLKDVATQLITGNPKKYSNRIDCSTSFGSIQLYLLKQAAIELTAITTFGEVKTNIPLQIEEYSGSGSVIGKTKDGGTIVNLTGKNSNIEIISQ